MNTPTWITGAAGADMVQLPRDILRQMAIMRLQQPTTEGLAELAQTSAQIAKWALGLAIEALAANEPQADRLEKIAKLIELRRKIDGASDEAQTAADGDKAGREAATQVAILAGPTGSAH